MLDDSTPSNETGMVSMGTMLLDTAIKLENGEATDAERAEAWREFAAYAQSHPQACLDLLVTMMKYHRDAGDGATAELLATKALGFDKYHPEVVFLLAERYAERGLHPQALELIRQQKEQGDLPPRADRILGLSSWRTGQMDAARTAFFRLATAVQNGEASWKDARTTVEFFKAENDRPTLRMLLESLSQRKSDDPELCLWMAEWLIEDLDDEQAKTWLERALELASDNQELANRIWRVQFALKHPEDAESYRKLTIGIFHNSPEDARKGLEDILSRHPDFTEARYFLGTCYRRQGKVLPAAQCFETVIKNQPMPNAYLELGALYGELGRPKDALEVSLKANEIFEGNNPVVLCNIAAAQLELGNQDACKEALERAREIKPDTPAIKRIEHAMLNPPKRRGCLGGLLGLGR